MRSFIFLSLFLFFMVHEAYGWGLSRRTKFNSPSVKYEASKYERWFTQNLDHFNPNDERTWQQRYYVNDEYVKSGSKNIAFLMIGGEGEATEGWVVSGSMMEYAKEVKAICFQLEHRYYGQSHPTEDLSTKNLQFLTSQQALADLAFFVEAMNAKYELPPDTKWIAFGGSYPGNLAAWLRQKYPHLIKGAMSASGPLLAQLDFPEYLEVVTDDLRKNSDRCLNAFLQGFQQAKAAIINPSGDENFDKLFNLCDPIADNVNNRLDVSNLLEAIFDNVAYAAQYDKDNRVFNVEHNLSINAVCEIMKDETLGTEMIRLAVVNNWLQDASGITCLDYKYDHLVRNTQNVSWDSDAASGARQWTYQTCTEFGYYQTSTNVLGNEFPLDLFIQQCADIFDPKYTETFLQNAVDRTNTIYGGLDIEVSNVVFVHGTSDPWKILGITKTRSSAAPAILIEDAAHCATMYPSSESDSPQLREARRQINQLIGSWLEQ